LPALTKYKEADANSDSVVIIEIEEQAAVADSNIALQLLNRRIHEKHEKIALSHLFVSFAVDFRFCLVLRLAARLKASDYHQESPPTNSLFDLTSPVGMSIIKKPIAVSGLSVVTTLRTADELGVCVMSIEVLSRAVSLTGSVVVSEATVCMHTPLSLHGPCVYTWLLKVTLANLRIELAAGATVTRSNWFGPKVITPESMK
jgi:hypothetical protein